MSIKKTTINNSSNIIKLEVPKTNSVFGAWERYITIDGKRIFHAGNVCSTCSVFFDRLAQLDQSSYEKITILKQNAIDALNSGLQTLDPALIDTLKMIMPNGEYDIILSTITPKLVYPGKTGDYFIEERAELLGDSFKSYGGSAHPQTEYYRIYQSIPSILEKFKTLDTFGQAPSITLDYTISSYEFFEFVIPLFASNHLDSKRTEYYKEKFLEDKMPTAVSLSIFDLFTPERCNMDLKKAEHWCLMHYLIDGHHKMYAAALLNKPLTLISFVPLKPWVIDSE